MAVTEVGRGPSMPSGQSPGESQWGACNELLLMPLVFRLELVGR